MSDIESGLYAGEPKNRTPATEATLRRVADLVLATTGETDIAGNAIPAGRPVIWTNRIDGQPLTATITSGASTWRYTWTYDSNGFVTAESGWVPQ